MKVLAANASPRDGGDSDVLCDRFSKGAADVIIPASPVYFYSMNALMKAFIDRCLPRYREIRDKEIKCFIISLPLRILSTAWLMRR